MIMLAGEAQHADQAGPNGGRVIESIEPHAEFLVRDDRKIQITFLTEELKPTPLGEQVVTAITGDRSNPTRMKFGQEGDVLLSDVPLPEGNNLPIILQIKPTPDARSVTEKFNLNLSDCPTCDYKEYACICGH